MPSRFLAWNAATQPSPTHCARFPISPLAAGCGCTIRLPPSANARRRRRTPRSSRPSSRSTGRAPTDSSQLAPVTPMTPRTGPLSALSSYIWIYPPMTFPARMLAGGNRYNAGSPVLTPTTMGDMPKYLPAGFTQYEPNNFSKKFPTYHVHSRRRFDSSSMTRGREDHRTPIGSRSR